MLQLTTKCFSLFLLALCKYLFAKCPHNSEIKKKLNHSIVELKFITIIDSLPSQFGLYQIIKESSHKHGASSSCIDLTFISQTNIVMEPGFQSIWHPNCNRKIIYVKFDLNIYYHLPSDRVVWHYQHANTDIVGT